MAGMARLNALYMIANAGSGHIGSCFSSLDIVSWIYLNELKGPDDVYFSSKGHDAPGLYAVLMAEGKLDFELLHKLRKIDGLPGHPDVAVEGMVTNTGSLGMGISKAKGMAFANRLLGKSGRIFVMTGDGELQEGQIWESLVSAANHGLGRDHGHRRPQQDSVGLLARAHQLVGRPGREVRQLRLARGAPRRPRPADPEPPPSSAWQRSPTKPKVIIADTIKGKGVGFMEGTSIDSDVEMFKFHSGAPKSDDYTIAAQELIDLCNRRLDALGAQQLELESVERPAMPAGGQTQRLFPAYGEALIDQAERNAKLVALDADLVLDMGLIPFAEKFPDRFLECGIAGDGHGEPGWRHGAQWLAAGGQLLFLLSLDPAQRADLQQRDRAHQDRLRRRPVGRSARRTRALPPVGSGHLRPGRRAQHGDRRGVLRSRGGAAARLVPEHARRQPVSCA